MISRSRPVGRSVLLRVTQVLARRPLPVMGTLIIDVAATLAFLCVTALPLIVTAMP